MDYLGNIWSVFNVTSTTVLEMIQNSDYNPLGIRHENSSYVYIDIRYLYNEKVFQDM